MVNTVLSTSLLTEARGEQLVSLALAGQVPAHVLTAQARELGLAARIGPLAASDERNTRFLDTLRCYLANARSWAATAEELSTHRQSLAYRLQQIEEATGRSLKSSRDLAELWIAVTAHDLFGPS